MLYITRDDRQTMLEPGRSQKAVYITQRPTLLVRLGGEDSPAVGNRLGHWQKVTTEPAIKTCVEPLLKLCPLLAGRQQFESTFVSRRNPFTVQRAESNPVAAPT